MKEILKLSVEFFDEILLILRPTQSQGAGSFVTSKVEVNAVRDLLSESPLLHFLNLILLSIYDTEDNSRRKRFVDELVPLQSSSQQLNDLVIASMIGEEIPETAGDSVDSFIIAKRYIFSSLYLKYSVIVSCFSESSRAGESFSTSTFR